MEVLIEYNRVRKAIQTTNRKIVSLVKMRK